VGNICFTQESRPLQ